MFIYIISGIPVQFVTSTDTCMCPFVLMRGLQYLPISFQAENLPLMLESYKFIRNAFGSYTFKQEIRERKPFEIRTNKIPENEEVMEGICEDELKICIDIVLENSPKDLLILNIDKTDMISSVSTYVSQSPDHEAMYFDLNGTMLDDKNHGNGFSAIAESKFIDKTTDPFHLVLVSDDVYPAQACGFLEKNLSKWGFVLLQSSEPEEKDALWKFERYYGDDRFIVIHYFSKPGHKSIVLCRKKQPYTNPEKNVYSCFFGQLYLGQ